MIYLAWTRCRAGALPLPLPGQSVTVHVPRAPHDRVALHEVLRCLRRCKPAIGGDIRLLRRSPFGVGTFAGADGSRQPTELELKKAEVLVCMSGAGTACLAPCHWPQPHSRSCALHRAVPSDAQVLPGVACELCDGAGQAAGSHCEETGSLEVIQENAALYSHVLQACSCFTLSRGQTRLLALQQHGLIHAPGYAGRGNRHCWRCLTVMSHTLQCRALVHGYQPRLSDRP